MTVIPTPERSNKAERGITTSVVAVVTTTLAVQKPTMIFSAFSSTALFSSPYIVTVTQSIFIPPHTASRACGTATDKYF